MDKLKYEPTIGESIDNCITKCLELSCEHNSTVEFTFNGIDMEVLYPAKKEHYLKLWKYLCMRRSMQYKKSEEGKLAEQKQKQKLTHKQNKLDKLVSELSVSFTTKELLEWLIDFTKVTDYCGTTYDKTRVLDVLGKLGFKEDAWVGYKGVFLVTQEIEWVVGQVISCINTFGSPHPMIASKCEELLGSFEIKGDEV